MDDLLSKSKILYLLNLRAGVHELFIKYYSNYYPFVDWEFEGDPILRLSGTGLQKFMDGNG